MSASDGSVASEAAAASEAVAAAAAEATPASSLGARLRSTRKQHGVSLRELARRTGVSASLLSRIETEKSQPSVSTLYALVSALGLSLDSVFSGVEGFPEPTTTVVRANGSSQPEQGAKSPSLATSAWSGSPTDLLALMQPGIQRASERAVLTLESGVTWERLTSLSNAAVDFLFVTYGVGGSSNSFGHLMVHHGVEWTYVVSGVLEVTVTFDKHLLYPGDTITFHSSTPHRLSNAGTEPVQAICVIFGRQSVFSS